MSRYPFTDCINHYMDSLSGFNSPETEACDRRHLMNIGRIFRELKADGAVSSDNPRYITAVDIDRFVGFRKKNGVKDNTIAKDLGLLKGLLDYYDNHAVDEFKAKFKKHIPKRTYKRKPPMPGYLRRMILDNARMTSALDWKMTEAYALVSLAICTGTRPKELRMLYLDHVYLDDDGCLYVDLVHVKGEGTYGDPRTVPVHPDFIPILDHYLEARSLRLSMAGRTSEAFFPPIRGTGEFISYNMTEKLKQCVEEDVGEKFTLYACRRTYGQNAVDEGHDLVNVSRVLGHKRLSTTQMFYCDKDQRTAAQELARRWNLGASQHSDRIED
ncbi:MAG: site-specific integrase [Thermoplasmata archaeon]|nr:site-specific integrase [Thermoplasmata archaeon]